MIANVSGIPVKLVNRQKLKARQAQKASSVRMLTSADYQKRMIKKQLAPKRSRFRNVARVSLVLFIIGAAQSSASAPERFRAELDDCSLILSADATQAERDAATLFSVIPDQTRLSICDAIRSAPETDQSIRNTR